MASSRPQITTVIPTFRRSQLLRRAIESVLAQTYPHLLVCVYDNASRDETAALVADLARKDNRVRYHCHDENIGWLKNFAYGLSKVGTPYFHLLSDDDVILPRFFEQAISALSQEPEIIAYVGATVRIAPHFLACPGFDWRPGFYPAPQGLFEMLRHGFPPDWTGIVFSSKVIERIESLDAELGNFADADFIFRAASTGSVLISSSPCAVLTLHNDTQSSREWSPAYYSELWLSALKKVRETTTRSDEFEQALGAARLQYARTAYTQSLAAAEMGLVNEAHKGADLLEETFGFRREAAMVRSMARLDLIGTALRVSLRALRQVRREVRFLNSKYKLRKSLPMIDRALLVSP
jgi:glycosyltransferase involved in cell wall biosynthesis